MLTLVITAGQSGRPRRLFICCPGTPGVAVVDQGSFALSMLFRHNLFSLLLGTKETIKKTIQ